jgi:hypothetical protein
MPAIASLEDLKSAQKDLCEILFESVSHNFLLTAHNCVLTLCSTLLALCCYFGGGVASVGKIFVNFGLKKAHRKN